MRKYMTMGFGVIVFGAALLFGGQYAYHRLFDAQPHYRTKFPANAIADQVIFSPDQKHLVLTGLFQIILLDADTGQKLDTWQLAEPIEALTFSPDSNQIVFYTQASDQLSVLTLATGAITTVPLPAQQVVKDLAFNPDGSLLAVAGTQTLLWQFPDPTPLQTIPLDSDLVTFSADGQHIMLVSATNHVAIYQTAHPDQGEVAGQDFPDETLNHMQLDATGQKVLLTAEDGMVFVVDPATLAILSQHQLPARVDTNLVFRFVPSPQTDLLAVLQVDRLWLFHPDNGAVAAEYQVDGHMIAVGFNQSGDTLAVYTHREDIYTLAVWGLADFLERYKPS